MKKIILIIFLLIICHTNAQCTDYNLYLFRVFQNPQNVLWGFQFENDWVYLKMVEIDSETGYDFMDDNDRKNFPKLAQIFTGMEGINFRATNDNIEDRDKSNAIKNIQKYLGIENPDGIWDSSLNQRLINGKINKYGILNHNNNIFEIRIYDITDMLRDPIGSNLSHISVFGYGGEAKASALIDIVKKNGSMLPPPFKEPFDDAMKSHIPEIQLMANKEYINDYLNKDKFPDGLRQYFMEKNAIELSSNVTVKGKGWLMQIFTSSGIGGRQWRIVDNDNKKEYSIKRVGENNLTIAPYNSIWEKIIILYIVVIVALVVIYIVYRFRSKIKNVMVKRKQPPLVGDFSGKLPGEESKSEPSRDAIKVGDKVVITLWSDMNTNLLCDQRVGKKKQITLLDRKIELVGLTAPELEEKIRTELSQELNGKQADTLKVNVNDKEFLVLKMTPELKPETVKEPETGKYYIKNGDTLNIAVRKGDAVPTESTVVAKDGYIEYGNINFNVYNITADEVSAKLFKYVNQIDPNATVQVSVVQADEVKEGGKPVIEEDKKAGKKDIQEVIEKVDGTDKRLTETISYISELEKFKNNAKSQIESLQQQIAQNEKRIQQMNEDLKKQNEKLKKQNNELEKLKEKNVNLQETMESTQNEWQQSAISKLDDVEKILTDKISLIEANNPIKNILILLDSISKKVESRSMDMAITNAVNILRKVEFSGADTSLSKPELRDKTIDEFKRAKWDEWFDYLVNRLNAISGFAEYQKIEEILNEIGINIVPVIVEIVDREEENQGGRIPDIEVALKTLMELTYVYEMDVKPGFPYDPDKHDLISPNSKPRATGGNQKIAKIINRGLCYKNGKIVKAKVSIQELT